MMQLAAEPWDTFPKGAKAMWRAGAWWSGVVAVVALLVMGACSGLVPPLEVDDLFGMDGLTIELLGVGEVSTAAFTPPITFTRGSCAYVTDTVCNYTASANVADHAIVVSASAASAKAVFDAMQAGATLEIQGVFDVVLGEPGLTTSASVQVTLNTSDGSIEF